MNFKSIVWPGFDLCLRHLTCLATLMSWDTTQQSVCG